MIIGQSVIQNGLVMALVSVVVSLYVIGLQRVRVHPRPGVPEGSSHEPSTDPRLGGVDESSLIATSHDLQ